MSSESPFQPLTPRQLRLPLFTQGDILAAVGLEQTTLQFWIRQGHVALKHDAPGTGRHRTWSALEVCLLAGVYDLTSRSKMAVSLATQIQPYYEARIQQYIDDESVHEAAMEDLTTYRLHLHTSGDFVFISEHYDPHQDGGAVSLVFPDKVIWNTVDALVIQRMGRGNE